ncbi:hypothetical protein I4U23_000579 [Adineta vaga]|nr:hypothetical protein I4U23_000579 [Adineta vaga]
MSTSRHRWSWRSCFAAFKHTKKSKKQNHHQPSTNLTKSIPNGTVHTKHSEPVHEKSTIPTLSILNKNVSYSLLETNASDDQYTSSSSCIIKVDSSNYENENQLIHEDSIQQIALEDLDSSFVHENSLLSIRATQLDSIVEDSNEENADDHDEIIPPMKLCCDREIVDDANNLHSRLFDLSQMNHVKTQFYENGNLLGEFSRQLEKLKLKTNDIIRASAQMPRDAELLEARYSSLSATLESLSILLKIAQIPACRALLNRLFFSIEQRTEQLNKLVQLTTMSLHNIQQRFESYDDDFLSFRSALSSYEQLFTTSS